MTEELASLDGHIAPVAETSIPVTDEGLLRGDGVFEVVRVYAGRPFALAEHLDRIDRSATNLRLGWAPTRSELAAEAARLLEARGAAEFDGCLRILLTRGGRQILITEPLPARASAARLTFVTYAPTRILDGIKSLSYAANMLATRIARESGFDEALLVTPHGRVLEAPTATLFWVDAAGTLTTPPLEERILASITRQCVTELLEVEERPCTREDLFEAQEAFLASTTREIQPVAAIEQHALETPGERTTEAAAALRQRIEAVLADPGAGA